MMLSSRLIRLIPFWQPQQHPARDAHDTFFISDPATTPTSNFPPDYLERVKAVHSKGGFGSQGYQYDWKEEEAQKNLLRTHTTAVSARMLYKLAQVVGGNMLLVYKYSHISNEEKHPNEVSHTCIREKVRIFDLYSQIFVQWQKERHKGRREFIRETNWGRED